MSRSGSERCLVRCIRHLACCVSLCLCVCVWGGREQTARSCCNWAIIGNVVGWKFNITHIKRNSLCRPPKIVEKLISIWSDNFWRFFASRDANKSQPRKRPSVAQQSGLASLESTVPFVRATCTRQRTNRIFSRFACSPHRWYLYSAEALVIWRVHVTPLDSFLSFEAPNYAITNINLWLWFDHWLSINETMPNQCCQWSQYTICSVFASIEEILKINQPTVTIIVFNNKRKSYEQPFRKTSRLKGIKSAIANYACEWYTDIIYYSVESAPQCFIISQQRGFIHSRPRSTWARFCLANVLVLCLSQ